MIITAKADGTLIKTIPNRVYQGSNNADTIVVVAPIIQTATMNIRFKKPQINEYTQNFLMTPANQNIYSDLGVSVWVYPVTSELTQYYGTVQAQFSATINGAIVSSGAFTFEVEKGVEVDLPDPEEANHTYDDIYDYLTNMSTKIFVNGELEAKAILPYDDLFAYSNGAVIFDGGDFYKSKSANNRGISVTTTSDEITSIIITPSEFKEEITSSGTYTFEVTDVGGTNYWYLGATQIGLAVNGLGDYGIYYDGTPVENDTIVIDYVKFPNTTNWDKIDFYSASEIDALLATFAGKKYPVGSTTGTGEVFNNYVDNVASGDYSHAEGYSCTASGEASHAEGWSSTASGNSSHAEAGGFAAAIYSHAEGSSRASGSCAHSQGLGTIASGANSHTEGDTTTASGENSHAGGYHSTASHINSFAHGDYVETSANNQAVFGALNDDDADALLIVGNGSSGTRSNAFVVKANGDIYGGDNKKLATKDYVDTQDATKQNVIDSSHKLSADLVDDTSTTNKFVTASEKSQITTNANAISGIEDLIPSQASSSNKLADKNFVNSSISTNTANFIGTFENVSDLEGYSGTITNNDYAFVINQELDFATTTAMNNYDKTLLTNYDYAWVENGAKYDLYRFDIIEQTWGVRATNISKGDVSLITAYNRYKYNSSTNSWGWEYTLNTSGFTANQWAAINSGITDSDVAQIGTNTTNIANKLDKESEFSIRYSPDSFNLNNATETNTFLSNDSGIKITNEIVYTGGAPKAEVYLHDGFIDITSNGRAGNTSGNVRIDGNYVETQNNKVTSLSSLSTDTEYPSAKCVYDLIGDVETLLASI